MTWLSESENLSCDRKADCSLVVKILLTFGCNRGTGGTVFKSTMQHDAREVASWVIAGSNATYKKSVKIYYFCSLSTI